MAFLNDLVELCGQHVEFNGRVRLLAGSEQTRMARRLTQSKQRLKHVHLRFRQALIANHAKQRVAVMGPHFVVQTSLLFAHVAVDGLLDLLRQIVGHLLFRAAQDEWPQALAEHFP